MCTVTVVPHAEGFRLACNRDERRSRPPALAPRVHDLDGMAALYPIDPAGGGTWVGVNAAGLAAALLNRTAEPALATDPGARSRGLVIPALLGHATLAEAVRAAARLAPAGFNPFRVLIVSARSAAIVTYDGRSIASARAPLHTPLMVSSSSLGDALVRGPRRRLFERLVLAARPERRLDAQSRFHRHQWSSYPAASVTMARAEACTVSRTFVDVRSGRATMWYEPLPRQLPRRGSRGGDAA